MSTLAEEADNISTRASSALDEAAIKAADRLLQEANKIARSWSGSNLGYHALVYFRGFASPPAGRQFDRNWGLSGAGIFAQSPNGWQQRGFEEVYNMILELAGSPNLEGLQQAARNAEGLLEELQSELESILATALAQQDDLYLSRQLEESRKLEPLTVANARAGQMPAGQMASQDPRWDLTLRLAPHQEVFAQGIALKSPYGNLDRLSKLARQVASHLRRAPTAAASPLGGEPVGGGTVFIGHGRSKEWMALNAFLEKRLGLKVDEFNRIPTAGIHTSERLQAMLDEATFAFLVLTGEDQQMDGELAARQNVVHEVGLFQGRLGLRRAIVMLEDGCEEFSNIIGLGQIRFPKGNITAAFEEVRATLEREGVLLTVTPPTASQ